MGSMIFKSVLQSFSSIEDALLITSFDVYEQLLHAIMAIFHLEKRQVKTRSVLLQASNLNYMWLKKLSFLTWKNREVCERVIITYTQD